MKQRGVAAVGYNVSLFVLHKYSKQPCDVPIILTNGIHELVARLVCDKDHAARLKTCRRSGSLDVVPYLRVRDGTEQYPIAVGLRSKSSVRQIVNVLRVTPSTLLYNQHFLNPTLRLRRLEYNSLAECAVILNGHTPMFGVLDAILHLTIAKWDKLHVLLNIAVRVLINQGSSHYGKIVL